MSTTTAAPPTSRRQDGASYYDDETTTTTSEDSKQQQRSCLAKFCCCFPCCCVHFIPFSSWKLRLTTIVTLCLYWAILYVAATAYNPGDRRFTLTVGDSWQVQPPPNLWSRSSLSIQAFSSGTASSSADGLEVYEFLPVLDYSVPARCPPLTLGDDPSLVANANSPIVTLHESDNIIHLEMDQYHYEYFHLNQGSVLKITAKLVQDPNENKHHKKHPDEVAQGGLGATNIYILQGYQTLRELETKRNNIDVTRMENFRGRSIEKRYMAYAGSAELDYTVPSSDYYIVVYDNAAPGRSTNVQVSITVQVATHYLSDLARPICSAQDTVAPHGCAWIFTNDQDRQRVASTCIIAKAVSPQLTQQVQQQSDTSSVDQSTAVATDTDGTDANTNSALPKFDMSVNESQTVIVQVHAPLGSTRLWVLALVPIAVLIMLWFLENGQRCIQHVRRNGWQLRPPQQQGSERMRPVANETTPLNNKSKWKY